MLYISLHAQHLLARYLSPITLKGGFRVNVDKEHVSIRVVVKMLPHGALFVDHGFTHSCMGVLASLSSWNYTVTSMLAFLCMQKAMCTLWT